MRKRLDAEIGGSDPHSLDMNDLLSRQSLLLAGSYLQLRMLAPPQRSSGYEPDEITKLLQSAILQLLSIDVFLRAKIG